MALFTNEFINYTDGAQATCRIGDNIWLVQQSKYDKFQMETMNIYTGEWKVIDFKNRYLIEIHNTEHRWNRDFSMFSSDGYIYMWQESLASSNILRFDTVTYEWTRLVSGMPKFREFNNSVVINNKVYGNSKNENLVILNMDTLSHKVELFNDVTVDRIKEVNLCEMNGLLYIIIVKKCGTRSVHYRDDNTKTYISISEGVDQRDYLKHFWCSTFAWSYNDKLYHARFHDSDALIIDCFDMETKCFTTIFEAYKLHCRWEFVIAMSGNDKEVYVTFANDGAVAVRVIDLKPTLETLSLMSLVKNTSEDDVDSVRNVIPSGLRIKFDNLFAAKTDPSIYKSDSSDTDSDDSDMEYS